MDPVIQLLNERLGAYIVPAEIEKDTRTLVSLATPMKGLSLLLDQAKEGEYPLRDLTILRRTPFCIVIANVDHSESRRVFRGWRSSSFNIHEAVRERKLCEELEQREIPYTLLRGSQEQINLKRRVIPIDVNY